jgi:hypothetical protein
MPGFGTNIKGCLEEIEIIYDLYGEGTFKWSDIRNIAKKSPKYYISCKIFDILSKDYRQKYTYKINNRYINILKERRESSLS